jgi:phage terminase small subunit
MEASRKNQSLKKNRHALDQRYRAFAEAFMDIGKPTFQRVLPSAIAAGYSESYARALAYRLLDNIGVQKLITKIRQQREKLDAAPAEEVLMFLTSVMRGDPAELERSQEEGEGLRALREMTAEIRRALGHEKSFA